MHQLTLTTLTNADEHQKILMFALLVHMYTINRKTACIMDIHFVYMTIVDVYTMTMSLHAVLIPFLGKFMNHNVVQSLAHSFISSDWGRVYLDKALALASSHLARNSFSSLRKSVMKLYCLMD